MKIVKSSGAERKEETKAELSFEEINLEDLKNAFINEKLDWLAVVDSIHDRDFCVVAIYKEFPSQRIVYHWGIGYITH